MNHITLTGRLTRDPELRYTPNGVPVANFDLTVPRDMKNAQGEREVDFIRIVSWQKTAELCANYLKKGRLCLVEGRLQIRSYEDQEGKKRYVTEVVIHRVEFLEKAESSQSQTPPPNAGQPEDDLSGINLDNLPF